MSKRKPSGMTFSHGLRQYPSQLLRAVSMIVAIEERKEIETVVMISKRGSTGTTCSQRLLHYASEILRDKSL